MLVNIWLLGIGIIGAACIGARIYDFCLARSNSNLSKMSDKELIDLVRRYVPAAASAEESSVDAIVAQMNEPRPLPMGRTEFGEWSYRIISGALLPMGENEDPLVFLESQKFALANMLMHLGPTESHKPDAYFIHSLRKFAVNQVADAVRKELHEGAKVRTAKKEEALKAVEAQGDETLARIGATSAS